MGLGQSQGTLKQEAVEIKKATSAQKMIPITLKTTVLKELKLH